MGSEKVIGILGGMGPEATLYLFEQIIRYTPASRDQEHFRTIIDSNPKVPDRTAAIMESGEDPVPIMIQGGRTLAAAGADFIIIPCISAHFFLERLQQEVSIPILSAFEEVAARVAQAEPKIRRIGLLATTGTIRGGLFQQILERNHVQTLVPEPEDQKNVMAVIYKIKAASKAERRDCKPLLRDIAHHLIENGAQGIIAGCTEIPLELSPEDVPVPLFDPLVILAQAAIREAKA
jgi:aspartate racemase